MNARDSIRHNLVTTFVCAKCGTALTLSYDIPKERPADDVEYLRESHSITGAAKVNNTIAIHPCKKCYGDAIEPIEAIRNALKIINPEVK